MRKMIAIIPVRKESERLKDKNILPFGESNLLIHKIRQLKKVSYIDEIVVSSEDDIMLEMAKREGVTALKRPIEYACKGASFGQFIEYICNEVKGQDVLWTTVTAPFVDPKVYNEAIKLYYDKIEEHYDSLITVQRHKRFMVDKNGSLNFRRGLHHKESEHLPELYLFTNGIVIAPRIKMIEWKYNWGHIPYMYEVDKKVGIDIKDEFDYKVATLIYENDIEEGYDVCQ